MDLQFDLKKTYSHTTQSIASEILQLLLVVERIKADTDSFQRLKSLAKVRDAFEESPSVRSVKSLVPFHTDRDNLPLSTLCLVLDKGLGATSFSSKSIRFAEYKRERLHNSDPVTFPKAPEQYYWSKVWTEDIPAIIDAQHYSFQNLNHLRLHYPHYQILLAYIYGKELLLIANKLIALDYSKFIELAQEWAAQAFSNVNNNKKKDSSSLPPILVHRIIERATEGFLSELVKIIEQAQRYLDWSFKEGGYVPYPKVEQQEKEWKDFLGHNLGTQPVLTVELLQADIKRAIDENDLIYVADKIAYALAQKIQPNEYRRDFNSSLEYRQSLFNIYENFATERTQLLWHANDNLQLNYNILLRGIGFSIWREKNQEKTGKKTAVLEIAKAFLKEEYDQPYANGTVHTIKQSYEKIKGYAKRSESKNRPSNLVELIRSQIIARFPFHEPKIRYVFAPFNIDYEAKIREAVNNLGYLLNLEINLFSYDDICKLFRALSGKDISDLNSTCLVEELNKIGIVPIQSSNRLLLENKNKLAEILREDIWIQD